MVAGTRTDSRLIAIRLFIVNGTMDEATNASHCPPQSLLALHYFWKIGKRFSCRISFLNFMLQLFCLQVTLERMDWMGANFINSHRPELKLWTNSSSLGPNVNGCAWRKCTLVWRELVTWRTTKRQPSGLLNWLQLCSIVCLCGVFCFNYCTRPLVVGWTTELCLFVPDWLDT